MLLHDPFTKALYDARRSLLAWTIAIVVVGAGYASFWPTIQTPEMTAGAGQLSEGPAGGVQLQRPDHRVRISRQRGVRAARTAAGRGLRDPGRHPRGGRRRGGRHPRPAARPPGQPAAARPATVRRARCRPGGRHRPALARARGPDRPGRLRRGGRRRPRRDEPAPGALRAVLRRPRVRRRRGDRQPGAARSGSAPASASSATSPTRLFAGAGPRMGAEACPRSTGCSAAARWSTACRSGHAVTLAVATLTC